MWSEMIVILFLIPFTVSLVIISVFFYTKWKFRSIRHIPGAPEYPLFGTALEFGLNPVDKLKDLVRLADIYGVVNRISIGPLNSYIIVSDPDLTEFFLSSPKFITKSADYDLLHPWLGKGLLTSTGSYWQKRRKIITPTFHFKILEQFVPIFNTGGDILIKRLYKEVDKDEFDIYPYITAYALDIICDTAMGTTVKAQEQEDNEYVTAVKTVSTIFINRTFSAWKQFDFLFKFASEYEEHEKSLNIIHGFTRSVIQKRRDSLMHSSNSDKNETLNTDDVGMKKKQAFLDLLLNSTIDGKPLTDDDITEEVDTFMFEGHDTTSSAICFAVYEISRNPIVQKQIVEELNNIFGDDKNRDASLQDFNNMKYLEATIKETLRLYPSVPYFARKLDEPVTYKGTTYPKDLSVMFFVYYMQRRTDLFKDALVFNPDRYLIEKNEKHNAFCNVPFSAGPRNCIGQKFAMYELKATLSKIIRNFELLPTDPKNDVILSPETILKSANGVPARLKKRI